MTMLNKEAMRAAGKQTSEKLAPMKEAFIDIAEESMRFTPLETADGGYAIYWEAPGNAYGWISAPNGKTKREAYENALRELWTRLERIENIALKR